MNGAHAHVMLIWMQRCKANTWGVTTPCHVQCPRRNSPKGSTTLFACVAINRRDGRPWPLSWHLIHLCTPFGSCENIIHSLAHFISSFKWDWWASSALHWVASSCGTSWVIWASHDLVTFGVCWCLYGLVIGGSLSRVGDCLQLWSVAHAGSWPSLSEELKGTLVNCSCH
jgi:hypothetical protein